MPVVPGGAYQQGPTCFDRMKLGFTIGFCVGMASGALFGGFSALRYLRKTDTHALDDSNIRNHEIFCYQIRIEGKGIVKQRRQGNASRRRHIWHVHGYWNRNTMLAHGRSYRVSRSLSFLLQLFVL